MDLKKKLRTIIFGYTTPAGKLFDVVLIFAILSSVIVVMLDSVKSIAEKYHDGLYILEWIFTVIFTIEYAARVYSAKKPWSYIFSFYGIIDLLSTIPTYIAIFVPGGQTLLMLRVFRLMRVFRVFKLGHYVKGSAFLMRSVIENRGKIIAFLTAVLTIVILIGSLMYIIEGSENGFTSIPRSIYWAVVTVTTVGFGDISPQTNLGQFLATILMLTGYSIIAVPTGIVSAGVFYNKNENEGLTDDEDLVHEQCDRCHSALHTSQDIYCWKCGHKVN